MPRGYRYISDYEKEILKLREQGKAVPRNFGEVVQRS